MKIKKFEEHVLNEQQISFDDYYELKENFLKKFDELYELYDELYVYSSSNNYEYYEDLKEMRDYIVEFYKVGDEESFKRATKDKPKWSHLGQEYGFFDATKINERRRSYEDEVKTEITFIIKGGDTDEAADDIKLNMQEFVERSPYDALPVKYYINDNLI